MQALWGISKVRLKSVLIFICKCICIYTYTHTNAFTCTHLLSYIPVAFMCDFLSAHSGISEHRMTVYVAFLNTYSWFYVEKSIDSNNNERVARTDWPAWIEIEPELNQLEPEEPTRAFSWRLDGCSEAIKSSRETSGHGSSSGFNSNKCFLQHFLLLICKPKSESLIKKLKNFSYKSNEILKSEPMENKIYIYYIIFKNF